MISLRHKIALGFGGLLLILIVVAAISVRVLGGYSHTLDTLFHENYDSALFCDAMRESLDDLNNQAQRSLWQPCNADSAQIRSTEVKFETNFARQLNNCTLPGERELTLRLGDLWSQYKQRNEQFYSASPRDAAAYSSELLPRYQELRRAAQQVAELNMANMVSVDGKVKRTLLTVRNTLVVLVILAIVLAAAFVGGVGAALLQPLKVLTRSARQIEQGKLDFRVPIQGKDELGHLAEAFNSMARELQQARLQDQNKIVRTQQTTQLAIDGLTDAVFLLGPDGRIELANRAAQQRFNVESGTHVTDAGHDWLAKLYERVRTFKSAVDPDDYESAVQIFEHGNERFFLPRAMPILDEGGFFIGMTAMLVDVTRLRHADEARGDLISTVSHELRTPLTSLRMSILMLAEQRFGALSDRQSKLLSAAAQESDRLYRIIENLLNLSRIESGRATPQLRSVCAQELAAAAIDPLREAFEQKQIQLDLQIEKNAPTVMADASQLGYAFSNLLTNALKFTSAHGQVRVTMQLRGQSLAIMVGDSGPGVPPEFAERIFEKFFRVPGQSAAGAGLGLAIARRIVETFGGALTYRPAKTGGSEFTMMLPAQVPPVPSPAECPGETEDPPVRAPAALLV